MKLKYVIEHFDGCCWSIIAICKTYDLAVETLRDKLRAIEISSNGYVHTNGYRIHSVEWHMPGFE